MEHIKEWIADFVYFKEEVGRNEIICNKIQTSISLWKEDLETVIEKNENKFPGEKNLIIGWAMMGSKKLYQWSHMAT